MTTDSKTRGILYKYAPVLQALAGTQDVVTGVCEECQFEERNGRASHSRLCGFYETQRDFVAAIDDATGDA